MTDVTDRLLGSLSPRTRNRFYQAKYSSPESRRRAQAVSQAPEGYQREAESLYRAYNKAVGYALQYRIPVHIKGEMKALGTLYEEIRKYERSHGLKEGLFPPPTPRGYCGTVASHRAHVWHALGDQALHCPGKAYS